MKKVTVALLVLCALVLAPRAVCAQGSEVRRPYRGLFSGSGPPSGHSLLFGASAWGGYDDNITAGVTGQQNYGDPRLQQSGTYYGGDASLRYSLAPTRGRFSFGSNASAFWRYYNSDDWYPVPHVQGTLTMRTRLARNVSFRAGYGMSLSRYYRFLLFPDVAGDEDLGVDVETQDMDLFARTTLRQSVSTGLSWQVSRRGSFEASYGYHGVAYTTDEVSASRQQSAGVRYSHDLTQHLGFNLGYAYSVGDRPDDDVPPSELHNLNVGVSYGRALSFSRRTSLSFSTGTAFVTIADASPDGGNKSRTRFRVLGSVALNHELGRSWTTTVAYSRRFAFREGFTAPYFTDGVTASLRGLVTRRLDFTARTSWSHSDYQGPEGGSHDSLWVTAQSSFALARAFAVYVRYVYYDYDFTDEVPLDSGIPQYLERQGVKAGVSFSYPLFR